MHIQSREGQGIRQTGRGTGARSASLAKASGSLSARVFGGSGRLNRKQCTSGSERLKGNKRVRPGCPGTVSLDHSSGPDTSARMYSGSRGTDVLAAKGAQAGVY